MDWENYSLPLSCAFIEKLYGLICLNKFLRVLDLGDQELQEKNSILNKRETNNDGRWWASNRLLFTYAYTTVRLPPASLPGPLSHLAFLRISYIVRVFVIYKFIQVSRLLVNSLVWLLVKDTGPLKGWPTKPLAGCRWLACGRLGGRWRSGSCWQLFHGFASQWMLSYAGSAKTCWKLDTENIWESNI